MSPAAVVRLKDMKFDDTWFKVNGVKYEGSLLCVGNLIMSWAPQKFSDITVERSRSYPYLRQSGVLTFVQDKKMKRA
ncbi:hypothetical protein CASFOL_000684 [Castilleja foliolosa]|uniref:Uncharacterized protein n=1 Tax=Castilleja foliolosa TaxID=1961234 RepID=A0ABD3EKF1_9LAMI